MNYGQDSDQTRFHAHIHSIPRRKDGVEVLAAGCGEFAKEDELSRHLEGELDMFKILSGVFIFFVLFLSAPFQVRSEMTLETNHIRSDYKRIQEFGGYIFAYGRWKQIDGNTSVKKPPAINTVHITCNIAEKSCKEVIAELVTESDYKIGQPLLTLESESYDIISVENNVYRLLSKRAVADCEIIISLKDDHAERSYRETRSRGVSTSDSNIYSRWVLQ